MNSAQNTTRVTALMADLRSLIIHALQAQRLKLRDLQQKTTAITQLQKW